MPKTPRDYPKTMTSPASGRPMVRGEKVITLKVDGQTFETRLPGWWCSLDDPDDLDGQLVDDDTLVAEDVVTDATEEVHRLDLSVRDSEAFVEALLNPQPVTDRLLETVSRYRQLTAE